MVKQNNVSINENFYILEITQLKVFLFVLIFSLFLGSFYVQAEGGSHLASEIIIKDFTGNSISLQEAIDGATLGNPGPDGRMTVEACRICVDRVGSHEVAQGPGACDHQDGADGTAGWTNFAGWIAGFNIGPPSGSSSSNASYRYRATGWSCYDPDGDFYCDYTGIHCSTIVCSYDGDHGGCCIRPAAGEWNHEDQNCNSYYWDPPHPQTAWYTVNQASNYKYPFDWYQPDVLNLCCKT